MFRQIQHVAARSIQLSSGRFTRLGRRATQLLLVLSAVLAALGATPALAVSKTVNGITVDVNLPQAQRGVDYSFQIAPTGQTSPYTFQILSGALPAGFKLSASGLVTGVNCTSANGSFNFDVRITAANGQTADFVGNQGFSINMTAGPGGSCSLTIAPASLPGGTVGTAYSQQLSTTGGTAPYTYALASGSTLPAGLTLTSGGLLSGTPTAAGTYTFTIQVTDNSARAGVTNYTQTISVAAVVITLAPASLPGGTAGAAYSQTITASGGTGPYSYTLISGALPAGLTLTSAGVLAGTPTTAGSSSFTLRATDNNGAAGTRAYNVAIAAPIAVTLAPATLPGGTYAVAYSETLTASGGTGPYTYAVTTGTLPAGFSLSSAGVLSGTPSGAGSSSFTVTATDSNAVTGNRAYTVVINAVAVVTLAPSTLPGGTAGTAYSQTLTASGGTGPYTFAVTSGSLPAGLTLSSTGVLSGTPSATGSSSFDITATDANGVSGVQSYSPAINAAVVVTLAPNTLPNGTTGAAYSQTLTASGGTGPYAFAVTSGALPAGLSLSSAGVLNGTPNNAVNSSFDITATDANGVTGVRSYNPTINAAVVVTLAPGTLPAGTAGTAYAQTLTASGGTGPYAFAVTSGALPAGLTLTSAGMLSGTPSAAGSSSLDITATDANGVTGVQSYNPAIKAAVVVTLAPNTLPNGTAGTAYSQTLTASGGTGPYAFAVTSGSLPAGLNLSSAGVLNGTPTNAGNSSFDITATDANGVAGVQSYSPAINAAVVVTLAPNTLPNGTAGTAYSQILTASGGTGPYAYAVTSGSLPAGLSLSSAGVLSGTPSAAGSSSFDITATDANDVTGVQSYSPTVNAAVLVTLAPGMLPAGTAGTAYSQTLTASGGTGPYAFAVSSGALPAGLSLSSAGVLNGTPSAAGSSSFDITATDANGVTGVRSYNPAINAAVVVTLVPSTLPGGTAGTAYSQTLTASGGSGPYTFAVTSGALPAGLTLTSAGVLSGTPSAAGTSSFDITATDANGVTGVQAFSPAISAAVVVTLAPGTPPNGTAETTYSQTIAASGGTGPYAYTVTSGLLPAGLTLSSAGVLTGTPSAAGSSSFDITATDANGVVGVQSYTFAINAAVVVALSPSALPGGTIGSSYAQTLTASDGTGPYAYAVTSGSLPAGLSLSAAGVLSGTPSAAGSSSFTVAATGANGASGTQAYTVTVAAPVVIALSPGALPAGTAGTAYSQTLAASGGTGPYTFAISAGSLPAGLTLSSAGVLSGTPATSGSASITIAAVDANGVRGEQVYSFTAAAAAVVTLAPSILPDAIAGSGYAQTLSAAGGTGPYTYTVTGGTLPAGLLLSSAGMLSGTPTGIGASSFTITATDANVITGTQAYMITTNAAVVVTVTTATLPAGVSGAAYAQTIAAAGGTGPYTFALTAGALPAGLNLSGTGMLSGTPTSAGSSSFTLTATDFNNVQGSQSFTLAMTAPVAVSIVQAALPGGVNGIAYAQTITASGGTGPYTYAVSAGTLPTGLTLSGAGVLSGTPSAAGASSFAVTATDANGIAGTRAYTLGVTAGAVLAVGPATLPPPVSGTVYRQSVIASGGTDAGYTYAVTGGTLPPGLLLGADGTISGTPNAPGSYAFTVTATDPAGNTGTQTFTVVVAPKELSVSAGNLTIDLASSSTSSSAIDLARLVTSSDPSSGPITFAIVGSPVYGTVQLSGSMLTYTATGSAPSDSFQFVAIQNGVRSAPATVVVRVTRADLAADPGLRAIAAGQLDTAARAGLGQLGNLASHLEAGLWDGDCAVTTQVSLGNSRAGRNPDAAPSTQSAGPSAQRAGQCRKAGAVKVWAAGAVSVDDVNLGIASDGVTVGLETRLSQHVLGGVAVGTGRTHANLNAGDRITSASNSISLYAAWQPRSGLQLSGAAGYSDVRLGLRRLVGTTGRIAALKRDGKVYYAYLGGAGDLPLGAAILSPYLRASVVDIRLAGASELPADRLAVRYGAASQQQFDGTLGTTLRLPVPLARGLVTPFARAEYHLRSSGAAQSSFGYADTPGGDVTLSQLAHRDGAWAVGAGARLALGPLQLMVEYAANCAKLSGIDTGTIKVHLGLDF